MMPIFLLHTVIGGIEFYRANLDTCLNVSPYYLYIIVLLFAICMCSGIILLYLWLLVSIGYTKIKRRRQRQEHARRLQGMERIVDDNHLNEGFSQ